jgi:hypothetical protein
MLGFGKMNDSSFIFVLNKKINEICKILRWYVLMGGQFLENAGEVFL